MDKHGLVLEEILQPRRDRKAAKRLFRRLLKTAGRPPKRIVTDKLASYAAAKREVAPTLERRAHKSLNNRAENSHLPFRIRERVMRSHRSPGGLQRFASMHSAVVSVRRPCSAVRATTGILRPRVRWDTSDGLFDEPVEVTRWTTLRAERSRARRSKHLRLWAGSGG